MATRSHWACLVEGLSASAQESYSELETALNGREVPELAYSRVTYQEGGFGSAQREYMRITRKDYVFDVCAAPFGKSFFFSWWMSMPPLPYAPLWTVAYFVAIAVGTAIARWPLGGSCAGIVLLPGVALSLGFGILFFMRVGILFDEGVALRIPFVWRIYRAIFAPETFYRADTQAMFEKSVHNAVLDVVNGKIADQGLRALTPEECRPIRPGTLGMFG